MGWIRAGNASSLSNSELISFHYSDGKNDKSKKILIAKIQDKIYATDGICTHEYADLSTGFLNEQEKTITCPLHLSVFKLDSGAPQNPPAELPLKTYNVRIEEDNGVYIMVEDDHTS
jgi:3-phenylpropionate/trans-cinnamate dioxygenase ferredoxin subunit